jgi:hypothetical protein
MAAKQHITKVEILNCFIFYFFINLFSYHLQLRNANVRKYLLIYTLIDVNRWGNRKVLALFNVKMNRLGENREQRLIQLFRWGDATAMDRLYIEIQKSGIPKDVTLTITLYR